MRIDRSTCIRLTLYFLNFLLLVGVLVFFLILLLHLTPFDFDESNSLRIAAQPALEILRILSLEQNFPLSYLIFHLFQNQIPLLKLFQFLLWLSTLFFAWKIIRHHVQDELLSRLALLLFMSTPFLGRYAFYSRVYLFTNLLLVLILYLLTQTKTGEGWRLRAGLGFLLTLLHPLGLVASSSLNLAEHLAARIPAWRTFFLLLLNLFLFVLNLWPKEDLTRIYLQDGVSYIENLGYGISALGPWFYAKAIFFYLLTPVPFVCFLLMILLSTFSIWKTGLFRSPTFQVLLASCVGFFFLPLVLPNSLNAHHGAFFLAPVVLTSVIALVQSPPHRTKTLMLILFSSLYLFSSGIGVTVQALQQLTLKQSCQALQSLAAEPGPSLVFTTFTTVNMIRDCHQHPKARIFLTDKPGEVVEISRLNEKDLLNVQARSGGIVRRPDEVIDLLGNSPDIETLIKENSPERVVFFYFTESCAELPTRLSLRPALQSYIYRGCDNHLKNQIFVFQKK